MTKEFSDGNFQADVIDISQEKPVLVDFFADWCGPCKIQGPIIDQLAKEAEEIAVVGKLNTEDNQATAEQYGVMSIPTIIIYRNGKVVETLIGLQAKENLLALLKKHI